MKGKEPRRCVSCEDVFVPTESLRDVCFACCPKISRTVSRATCEGKDILFKAMDHPRQKPPDNETPHHEQFRRTQRKDSGVGVYCNRRKNSSGDPSPWLENNVRCLENADLAIHDDHARHR